MLRYCTDVAKTTVAVDIKLIPHFSFLSKKEQLVLQNLNKAVKCTAKGSEMLRCWCQNVDKVYE